MKSIEIKSVKQENGLFGMPLQVIKLDKAIFRTPEHELLSSAILVGCAEQYPNHKIEVFWSDEGSFFVKFIGSDIPHLKANMVNIKLNQYKLDDNKLSFLKP